MALQNTLQDSWKQAAGTAAAQLVEDKMLVGLGTGSTAACFIQALALRIQQGLRIAGAIPSSEASAQLAIKLGIPLTTLDAHPDLDLYVDGADEIDAQLRLIKGAGGALVREKIVASSARRFIVVADSSKKVAHLGLKFPVPVETTPFAVTPVTKHLTALGATVVLRQRAGKVFVSDNQNLVLDCTFPQGIDDPEELDVLMHHIVGIVETGLFINLAQQAIIGGAEGLEYLPLDPLG